MAKLIGFKTIPENKYCKDLEEVIKFHERWIKGRQKLNFECDGVVVVVNNNVLSQKIGRGWQSPALDDCL